MAKKTCNQVFQDRVVMSEYSNTLVRTSKLNGEFLGAVKDAVLRNIQATKARLMSATSTTEGLGIVLNGGWMSLVNDNARHHSGQAFKIETLEVIEGYADTLTISVEIHQDHTGLLNTVQLVPTVSSQRFYCATCAYETTKDLETGTFYSVNTNASSTCYVCHKTSNGGALVKITYHVAMARTTVTRPCGCADIAYRGVVVGDVLDVTPLAVVNAIRSVRASVANLGENALSDVLSPVKAVTQFDAKVLHAVNLWTGQMVKANKQAVIRVSL